MIHVPPGANAFGLFTNSWGTARPSATWGTSITSGSGSKGSWTQVQSALSYDAYGVMILVHSSGASTASRNYVMDVGVDPAGGSSYTVRIPDLIVGGGGTVVSGTPWVYYYFPLHIKAGSTVAVRGQGSVTTAFYVGMQFMQQPMNKEAFRSGSFVESYGITAPGGTTLTLGTTSEGSWQSLGTTVLPVWWWQVGFQVGTADTSWNNAGITIDVAVGDATNKNIIISDMVISTSTAEALGNPQSRPWAEFPVKAGTGVYIRGQHSGTVDTPNVAVYALGG